MSETLEELRILKLILQKKTFNGGPNQNLEGPIRASDFKWVLGQGPTQVSLFPGGNFLDCNRKGGSTVTVENPDIQF